MEIKPTGESWEQNMSITTLDKLRQRRGAAVLLEVLRSEGARYIFGNPGTTELPLIDILKKYMKS